jgi:hypothetical protein
MNERIRELAEQCGFRSDPDIYDRNQSFDVPKFAELIINECADIATLNQFQYDTVGRIVREHFGITGF